MADKISGYNLSKTITTFNGLNVRRSRIGGLGFLYIDGTTTSAIAQWSYFNMGDTCVSSKVIIGSGIQVASNGDVKFSSAIASGTTYNALIVYMN